MLFTTASALLVGAMLEADQWRPPLFVRSASEPEQRRTAHEDLVVIAFPTEAKAEEVRDASERDQEQLAHVTAWIVCLPAQASEIERRTKALTQIKLL